jgi:hypothetical protein
VLYSWCGAATPALSQRNLVLGWPVSSVAALQHEERSGLNYRMKAKSSGGCGSFRLMVAAPILELMLGNCITLVERLNCPAILFV